MDNTEIKSNGNDDTDDEYSKIFKYNSTIERDENNKSISFKVCNVNQNKWELKRQFKIEDFILKNNKRFKDLYSIGRFKIGFKKREQEIFKVIKDIDKKLEKKKLLILQTSMVDSLESFGALNSFVYSAWESYNNHHHLVLRPDNIWMAILTQFSFYANKNSKELKEKFVDFQGKRSLTVKTDYSILKAPFDELTIQMSNQIQSNIKDPSIRDLIIPNFSTTTESDRVAFSIALMSTMKKYFKYRMITTCGLSEVTLLGEINDWIDLKERTEKLKQFDNKGGEIKKWLDQYLLPILDKFIESANGNPDTKWWNQMVDYRQQSGGSVLTGWLATFCVFNNNGDYKDDQHVSFENQTVFPWPRVDSDSIPNGYVSCPISLKDINKTYKSKIYSGHFASKLLDNDSKLIPSLDWFIIAKV
ncbi:hypothetical protein ACTA71_000221 [Dictyostelium dimigraforme]